MLASEDAADNDLRQGGLGMTAPQDNLRISGEPIFDEPTPAPAHRGRFNGDWLDVWFTLAIAIAAILALWYYISDAAETMRPALMLTAAAAGLAGWGVGIIATPYHHPAATGRARLWQLALAVLFGYGLARFDAIATALSPAADGGTSLLPYVGVGLVLFLVAALTTYVLRSRNAMWNAGG